MLSRLCRADLVVLFYRRQVALWSGWLSDLLLSEVVERLLLSEFIVDGLLDDLLRSGIVL